MCVHSDVCRIREFPSIEEILKDGCYHYNNIAIKTEYNIGDVVYIPGIYYDYYPINKPFTVKNILCRGITKTPKIIYELECDATIEYMPDGWLSQTYEECAKWCEEHNKAKGGTT
jgi:hypothetical protein